MRRIATCLAIATLLAAPDLARAAEEAKPAEGASSTTTTTETTPATTTPPAAEPPKEESGSMGGGMHDPGGLFDTADQTRRHGISAFALVPYDPPGYGIGFALRYTLPIVHNGFISKLNDSFLAEFGADISYSWYNWFGSGYSYLSLVIPAAEARWSFHFTKRWEAYAKAGIGFRYRSFNNNFGPRSALDWVYINVGVGGLLHLNDTFAVRAEIGYGGLRVGMGFAF